MYCSTCSYRSSSTRPTGIANDRLIFHDTGKFRADVDIKSDFRSVRKEVFEFLFRCYGGGPVIYFYGELSVKLFATYL